MNVISSLDKYQQEMLEALKSLWKAEKNKEYGYEDLDTFLLNFFHKDKWKYSIDMLNNCIPEESENLVLVDLGVLAKLCNNPEIFTWLDTADETGLVSEN